MQFQEYVREKMTTSYGLRTFYKKPVLRILRWYSYINRQRSEAKMLEKLSEKLGSPENAFIAIGDWDQKGHHMRGKEPTKGKGMRKVLRQYGYKVYLVDEYKTSCTCHNCHTPTEKFRYRISQKPKTFGQNVLVHGLLRCQSQHECKSLWNRDVNGSLNIRMLANLETLGQERPIAFQRIHS